MPDIRVGGGYVDLYIKNIDTYTKNIDTATKKLNNYIKEIQKLEKEKKKLTGEISNANNALKNNAAAFNSLQNNLNNVIARENELKKSFKETTDELERQVKELSNFKNESGNIAGNFNALKSASTIFKGAIAAISAKELYNNLIQPNIELENYIVSFTTLLGSLENAQKIMDEITTVAAKTPLGTADIANAVQLLSQFGVAQNDLIPTFNKLANLAGGQAEKLNSIALAYGKIKGSGKVTLEQLNVLTERGVPILQALADVTGNSVAEIYKLVSAGKLGIKDIDAAIEKLAGKGGKFAGLLDAKAATMSGRISTLKDNIALIGRDIGEETFKQLSVYIQNIIDEIDRLGESGELEKFTKTAGAGLAELIRLFADVLQTIYKFKDGILLLSGTLLTYNKTVQTAETLSRAFGKSLNVSGFSTANIAIAGISAAIAVATKEILEFKMAEAELVGSTEELINTSEKLVKTHKENEIELATNTEAARALSDELQNLTEKTSRTAEEKERINEIISKLNEIYPELNLKYSQERDELNKNVSSLDEYIEKYEEYARLQANKELYEGVIKQQEQIYTEIQKQIAQLNELQTASKNIAELQKTEWNPFRFAGMQSERDDIGRNIAILRESIAGLRDEYNSLSDVANVYKTNITDLTAAEDELNNSNLENVDTYDSISDAIKTANDSIDNFKQSTDEFSKTTNNAINVISSLTDTIIKNASETDFSNSEILKLIQTYPELADKIIATADGYRIEAGALETLRQLKIEAVKTSIRNQINETNSTIDEINYRIKAYRAEGKAVQDLIIQKAELSKNVFNYQKTLKQYEKQLQVASAPRGRSTRGGTKTKTTARTQAESADELAIRNLKYQYDTGVIDAEKYYNNLEKIKDKYYKNGSKKWQQYTLEVMKGRKQIESDAKKAAEAEFTGTIDAMRENIEDKEYYNKIDEKQKIESLNKIRDYILQSYIDRKIDYENYAEQLRQIDKDIYGAEKDALKNSINALDKERKAKYDKAVKQVEDYYKNIQRAQEDAEREQEIRDLKETEALYEGAVSRAGQEKLKSIQKDIQKLEKEKMTAKLEEMREYQLENLDAKYSELENSQNNYFNTIQDGVKTTAEIVAEYTAQINSFFENINGILTKTSKGGNTQNLTINQKIYDSASNKAAVDMSRIVSSYGIK